MTLAKHIKRAGLATLAALVFTSCGKDCKAPAIDSTKLESLRRSLFSSGPAGYLVVPNPIEATRNLQATISDTATQNAFETFRLAGLTDPNRLENDFIKVRIKEIKDDLSTLAKPNSKGAFAFKIEDPHYSEVMAFHSVYTVMEYVQALGFSVVQSRPLYIMVRAATNSPNEVNALYDHNYLNPDMPRTMRLFGETRYAPGMDRDMYWHEFGHLFNESASREKGMDFAGDRGAVFSEGSALHECLADLRNNFLTGKPTIGRWLARNIDGYSPGEPLRYATDRNDGKSSFGTVITADGSGSQPERYTVAEWCTRVAWEIREKMVKNNPQDGNAMADRLVFSAVSLLPRDASIRNFYQALMSADEELHCGEYSGDIEEAFGRRGFTEEVDGLSQRLRFSAEATSVSTSRSTSALGSPSTISFKLSIANPNNETARNVRVKLETSDPNLHVTTYQQSYGDLPPGKSLSIGGGKMGYEFSVSAEIDKQVPRGRRLSYRVRVFAENGGENVVEGQVQP